MITALIAAAAMFADDLIMTVLTQAEARNRWLLAGILDSIGWVFGLIVVATAVGTVLDHGLSRQTIEVVAAVTVANFAGTAAGTLIGKRWVTTPTDDALADHEQRLRALEQPSMQTPAPPPRTPLPPPPQPPPPSRWQRGW
jgi:hypothetical protein